jgi:hypothetical protein
LRRIRDTSPSEWADVVEFEAAIRKGNARANASGNRLLGQAFLHRSRVPLDQAPIDHVTTAERAALQEEFGAAGQDVDVVAVDGCSPWACRGGEVEEAAGQARDDFGLGA